MVLEKEWQRQTAGKSLQHADQKAECAYRLKKRYEFVCTAKYGRHIKTDYFVIQFLKNRSGSLKWGVTAVKKIFKKAHDRNFAKRRLRSIFRQNYFFASGNIVLIAVPKTITAKFKDIEDTYISTLKKIKTI